MSRLLIIFFSLGALMSASFAEVPRAVKRPLLDVQQQETILNKKFAALRSELQALAKKSVALNQQIRQIRKEIEAHENTIHRLKTKQQVQRNIARGIQDKLRQNLIPSKLFSQNSLWLAWLGGLKPTEASLQHSLTRYNNTTLEKLWSEHRRALKLYRAFAEDVAIQKQLLQEDTDTLNQQRDSNQKLQADKSALLQKATDQQVTLKTRLKEQDETKRQEIHRQLLQQQQEAAHIAKQASGTLEAELEADSAQQTRDTKNPEQNTEENTGQNTGQNTGENVQLALLTTTDSHSEYPKQGNLLYPLSGKIQHKHPIQAEFDLSDGLMLAGDVQESVLSPFSGRVVFAKEYGDMGKMIIIKHNHDFFSLLWHLERIEVIENQWLLRGEPLGTARQNPQNNAQSLVYFEFRQNTTPLQAQTWLASPSG